MRDIKFEYMRGKGPGGQHKNKTCSCVRATHIPTGIQVTIDGRYRAKNKKVAIREIKKRVHDLAEKEKGVKKKARRDLKIHDKTVIRTYNKSKQTVKDHRSKKTASFKDIVEKGRLELLRD